MDNNSLKGQIKEDFYKWLVDSKRIEWDESVLIEWLDSIGIYVGVFAGMYDKFNWNIQVRGTWKTHQNPSNDERFETRELAYEDLFIHVVNLYNEGRLISMPSIETNRKTFKIENKKVDIKYLGVPNICFSLLDEGDKRETAYKKQRIERGFDDSETWSLSGTLANFLLPRLIRFNEVDNSERDEKYNKDMKNFIALLEYEIRDEGARNFTKKEFKQIKKGLKAFKRLFFRLWW